MKVGRGEGPPAGDGGSGRKDRVRRLLGEKGTAAIHRRTRVGDLTRSGRRLSRVAGGGRQGDFAVPPDADLSGRAHSAAGLAAAGVRGAQGAAALVAYGPSLLLVDGLVVKLQYLLQAQRVLRAPNCTRGCPGLRRLFAARRLRSQLPATRRARRLSHPAGRRCAGPPRRTPASVQLQSIVWARRRHRLLIPGTAPPNAAARRREGPGGDRARAWATAGEPRAARTPRRSGPGRRRQPEPTCGRPPAPPRPPARPAPRRPAPRRLGGRGASPPAVRTARGSGRPCVAVLTASTPVTIPAKRGGY